MSGGFVKDCCKPVRHQASPNLSPFRFLRLIASEYLAAYDLAGQTSPPLLDEQHDDWPDEVYDDPDDPAADDLSASVIDISAHPGFDGSALTPMWDEQAPAQPSIGA